LGKESKGGGQLGGGGVGVLPYPPQNMRQHPKTPSCRRATFPFPPSKLPTPPLRGRGGVGNTPTPLGRGGG